MSGFLADNLEALRRRTGRNCTPGAPIVATTDWSPEARDAAAVRLCAVVGNGVGSGVGHRVGGSAASGVPSTFVVVGSGGGEIVDIISARHPGAEIILLEPDPGAATQFLSSRDWTAAFLSGRLMLLVGPDYAGASGAWRPDVMPAQRCPVLILPELARRLPIETEQAERLVVRLIEEARANAEARRAHAARYVLHTLANAAVIGREGDVSALTSAFPRVPAIIVGAGPSLDGRLGELAAIADRAIVIACAAAARPLTGAGITPRFIVAVDPSESNGMHLVGLQNARTTWLVGEGSLYPTAFAGYGRRTFTFNISDHHPWPWLASLGITRGRLETWGSGASSALDFALRLGCSPILFAGLDFAFTDGRPYCRGTTFESQWALSMTAGQSFEHICQQAINRWPVVLEPDADGHLVRTAPHLVSFRNWTRQRIEAEPRVRFKHVTPGGILHHPCIEQISCEDALVSAKRLDNRQIEARIRARHRSTPAAGDRLFRGIDQLLRMDSADRTDDLWEAWLAFSGHSLRRETFAAALATHEYDAWRLGHVAA